jgi:hypothetical protein
MTGRAATLTDVSPEDIKRLFIFDNGRYYWQPRPLSDFKTATSHAAWNKKYAGAETMCTPNGSGYKQVCINHKTYSAHRVIWAFHYGEWPANQIDHINGDRGNNDISNLRVVTSAENGRNQRRRRTNVSGHMGVHWNKKCSKWQAQLSVGGDKKYLGLFDDIEEAVAVRAKANIEYNFHPNHGSGK